MVLTFLVVNVGHSGIAVRPCCTILLSYGRPCLSYHRGTILASTGCAHQLRSYWESTKRSMQRLFVLQVHPASGWLSLFSGVAIHVTGWSAWFATVRRTRLAVQSAHRQCDVQACFVVVHRFFWPTLVSVHGCPSMRVYVQAPTTVFNECYVTHRHLAKDLCAPVPGGREFPLVGVVLFV